MADHGARMSHTVEKLKQQAGLLGFVGGPALAAAYLTHPPSAPLDTVASAAWIWIHAGFMLSLVCGIFLLMALLARYLEKGGGMCGFPDRICPHGLVAEKRQRRCTLGGLFDHRRYRCVWTRFKRSVSHDRRAGRVGNLRRSPDCFGLGAVEDTEVVRMKKPPRIGFGGGFVSFIKGARKVVRT